MPLSKVSMSDINNIKSKINELENFIIELDTLPKYKLYKQVREIRELQNDIESQLRYIISHLDMAPTKVKFAFDTLSHQYRSRQGKYEKKVNSVLFKKPGKVSSKIKSGKQKNKSKKKKKSKKSFEKNLDKKLDNIFTKINMNKKSSSSCKNKMKSKILKAKKKAPKGSKMKVKVKKSSRGKPKIKVKFVRKNK